MKQKILIVDGHSMIFQWPELSQNYATEGASVRETLIRMLTGLQDNSDWTVAVVFDGRGTKILWSRCHFLQATSFRNGCRRDRREGDDPAALQKIIPPYALCPVTNSRCCRAR